MPGSVPYLSHNSVSIFIICNHPKQYRCLCVCLAKNQKYHPFKMKINTLQIHTGVTSEFMNIVTIHSVF